jgi:hypothetical protein
MIKSKTKASISGFRGNFMVRAVINGADAVTDNAYPVTNKPAKVIDIEKLFAIMGSMPTTTNSVIPIAKAVSDNAKSDNGILFLKVRNLIFHSYSYYISFIPFN